MCKVRTHTVIYVPFMYHSIDGADFFERMRSILLKQESILHAVHCEVRKMQNSKVLFLLIGPVRAGIIMNYLVLLYFLYNGQSESDYCAIQNQLKIIPHQFAWLMLSESESVILFCSVILCFYVASRTK